MNTDDEWKRLQDLYGSMSDSELTSLYERKGDLTEVAQQAIATEFRGRGLQIDEDDEAVLASGDGAGMVYLWRFEIASEANDALALLENQEISAEMKPVPQEISCGSTRPVWELHVAQAEKQKAVELLRKKKGLFPLAENIAQPDGAPDDEDMFVVAEFDQSDDADVARNALQAADIRFYMSEELDGEQTIWRFEVARDDLDRAGEAMEQAMRENAAGDGV